MSSDDASTLNLLFRPGSFEVMHGWMLEATAMNP